MQIAFDVENSQDVSAMCIVRKQNVRIQAAFHIGKPEYVKCELENYFGKEHPPCLGISVA